MNEYTGELSFIKEIEGLKSVTRTAWTSTGRHESTAEHSWRLAMFALALSPSFPELDVSRVLSICLVHDLGELYDGDISAILSPDAKAKSNSERAAVERATVMLNENSRAFFRSLWQEYEQAETPEARFVKALDKLETIVQHNQGNNPPDFDYEFNLTYGKSCCDCDPRLARLRALIDADTLENARCHGAPD